MKTSLLIANALTDQNKTLATAESCTGGLIANILTDIPGSSVFFKGGVIAYANEIKTGLLGVPAKLLIKHGAVSAPVAKAMAEGARKRLKTDVALATTGIAGPTGATPTKPVGLVFIALASTKKTIVKQCFFTGTRVSIKKQAAATALRLLLINL
ncbi:MAG: CinA family protein [Candidatus Omnitrophica bacterium]|nr:CinA family protein [Candidatus Omnitrophota bacterium]